MVRFGGIAGLALVGLVVCACTSGPPQSEPSVRPMPPSPRAPAPTVVKGTPPPPDPLAGWSLEEKVGQLFMVGANANRVEPETLDALAQLHIGAVFLHGRSRAGAAAIGQLTEQLRAAGAGGRAPLFVSTDQEGGQVQVLKGPGFSAIPSARVQATWSPDELRAQAAQWGSELAGAGVNMNLAPVMDLVPDRARAAANEPIGKVQRNYGFTPESAVSLADAFSDGMRESGVLPVIKHFPGLGRVARSTDTTARVTDTETTRDDPSIAVFGAAIAAGARLVMMSLATYALIDPDTPAVFSPVIVRELLRGELGFTGIVMTDDVSAAAGVQAWAPAERAILAISAGVDLILLAAGPGLAAPMVEAVVDRAKSDPAFAAMVDAAARRVVAVKESVK